MIALLLETARPILKNYLNHFSINNIWITLEFANGFLEKNAPLQSSSSTPHSNLSKSKSLVTDIRKKKNIVVVVGRVRWYQ